MKSKLTKNFERNENISKKEKLKLCISSMSNEQKFKFWIKTLISSFNTFPEIIKTLDKIIEIQASSLSFASDIYNKSKSTYNQVEKVIDLSERKSSLLNIYIMSKKMIKSLSSDNFEFLEKRFIYNWSSEELAKEFDISIRTVYRKTDKIIDLIYDYCTKNNWSIKFIETQIKEEGWLKEKYLKFVCDYFKNLNYNTGCIFQSKSSSES